MYDLSYITGVNRLHIRNHDIFGASFNTKKDGAYTKLTHKNLHHLLMFEAKALIHAIPLFSIISVITEGKTHYGVKFIFEVGTHRKQQRNVVGIA